MSNPLTLKINGLITLANATTGESDTKLTDAINSLIEGYGGSSTDGVYDFVVTNNDEHQTVATTFNNMSANIANSVLSTCGRKGYSYSLSIYADSGYTAGTLSSTSGESSTSGKLSGTLTENTYITASASTQIIYTVTIIQSDHQTITVTCDGIDYTDTFTTTYGKILTATIEADDGYVAGNLNLSNTTVTDDVTISATEATAGGGIAILYNSSKYYITITENESGDAEMISREDYYEITIGLSYTLQTSTTKTISVEYSDGDIDLWSPSTGKYEFTARCDITLS